MKDRTLALAGVLQATRLVRQIASTGEADAVALSTSIDSVFRIDANSVAEVYGIGPDQHGARPLQHGLRSLIAQIDGGSGRDPALLTLVSRVLNVERRFAVRGDMIEAVHKGIVDIARQRDHYGTTHPTVLSRLGELYAGTFSQLKPRILVQGNPVYLGQPPVVAEIRATLFAALRSAVLWRQLGGSYWDVLLKRPAMAAAARQWLGEHPR